MSKLHFYRFVLMLGEHLKADAFKIAYMGKFWKPYVDLLYIFFY